MTDARVPPQNLDAEESVLGAMLMSAAAIDAVMDVVQPADFYRESHGVIFRTCLLLYGRGEPVDAITLRDQLDKDGQLADVTIEKIQELASLMPAAGNAAHYARIVRREAVRRELDRAGRRVAELGWTGEGEEHELVDQAEQTVFALNREQAGRDVAPIRDIMAGEFARITTLFETGADVTGVPSGFRDIDRLTAGFQPGSLIVVAARPSMGKSALATCVIANAALRHQVPVALFTLEMSRGEVAQRLMCSEGKVELQRLRTGRLAPDDWPRLVAACAAIEDAPIYVDDHATASITGIRSKLRRLKARRPDLGLVVVDYLQLMGEQGARLGQRVEEISKISRGLKQLAQEFDLPIVALSQLSRAVELRVSDKRPILSDLRDSGSIEQDADIVMFIYRDEYYNPETTDARGIAEIHLAKQRNGPTGTEKLAFQGRYARFTNLAAA